MLIVAKSLNLNVIGVAFHIGSGCKDFTIYRDAIASARDVFDMGTDFGFDFHLLDIGGGFPGNKDSDIFEVSKVRFSISRAVSYGIDEVYKRHWRT